MNPRTLIVGAVGAACLISPSTGLGHTGAVAGGCYYDPAGTAQLGSSFTYQKFPVNVSSVVNYSATFDNVIVEQGRVVIRPTFSGQTLTVEGRRVPTTFGTHSVTVSTWWDLPGSKQRIDRSFTVTCPDNRPPVFPTPTPVPPVSEVVPGPTGGPADDEVVKLPSKPDRLSCAALIKAGAGRNSLKARGCIKPKPRFKCPPYDVTRAWQRILRERHGVTCPAKPVPGLRRTPIVAG